MSYETEREVYKGFTLRIVQDEGPEEPDWGEDEVFLTCNQRNYRFGRDIKDVPDPESFLEWGEGKWGEYGSDIPTAPSDGESEAYDLYEAWQEEHAKGYTVWPFWCGNVHGPGSFTISIMDLDDTRRRDPDGWVFVKAPDSPLDALAHPERDVVLIRDSLTESYEQWANGDVWGYIVENADGEELESCWGYYGTESAVAEGKATADHLHGSTRPLMLLILRHEPNVWDTKTVQAPVEVADSNVAVWAMEKLFGVDPTIVGAALISAFAPVPNRTPLEQLALAASPPLEETS